MRQEIIDLYDQYAHHGLDRRTFFQKLTELTGSSAAAAAAFAAIAPSAAKAALVAPDDPRLHTESIEITTGLGPLKGYLVRPVAAPARIGAVIVVHENRGLNPHIQDVTRRMGLEGFLAFAPDFLSPLGGTPEDPDQAREMIGKLDMDGVVAQATAAIGWLENRPDTNGRAAIMGFCWGGGVVGAVAVAAPELDAGVVYYGRQPDPARVKDIRAPLLLHYAGMDQRINEGIPAFQAALDAAGVRYELHLYEGAQHAFNNDTSAERYDKAAADLAWSRTVAFLREHLGASS